MFRIGEFAKLGKVSVKTLRYYDEVGLLKPAAVDPFTDYRYYSASQLSRLNRILALKDLGLSLEQIERMLSDDLTADQIRGMLRLKQAEIAQRLESERARLTRVEARLKQIEQEGTMPEYEVVINKVEPQMVMGVRDIIPTYADVGRLFREVESYVAQHGGKTAGPCMAIYYDEGYRERDVDAEAATPVAAPLPETDRIKYRQVRGYDTMACAIHKGSYEGLGEAHKAIHAWVQANGYRFIGPDREVYLRGHSTAGLDYPEGYITDDPAEFLTEVQYPVEKV